MRERILLALIFLIYIPTCLGQNAADTRSLAGNIKLDFGIANQNFPVSVKVSNHAFIITSIFPFSTVRPEISSVTKEFIIPRGQSSVDYFFNNISTNAVNHVVEFRCDGCEGVFTPQYYSPNGNRLSRVFITPDQLSNNLNFTLATGTFISGSVSLPDNKNANKDLFFLLSVVDSRNPSNVFRRVSITIPKGNNSAIYSIDGLTRETSAIGFNLELECLNCPTTPSLNFPTTLNSSKNHTNVDFEVDFQEANFLPAIYHLLMTTISN